MRKFTADPQALFRYRGLPPVGLTVSMALQHLVSMIVGCVTPAIIIAHAAALTHNEQVLLIQASLVLSAVTTLLQLFPIGGRFGSGLPVIFGVSFAYLPSMQAIATGRYGGGGRGHAGGRRHRHSGGPFHKAHPPSFPARHHRHRGLYHRPVPLSHRY